MKKPKVISANKFFSLLSDGNYTIAANGDGSGKEQYLAFVLKVNQQAPVLSAQVKEYCFLKIETDTEIKLIAISGDGEIAKIIKPKS
jgi:hypothetical protein